MEELRKWNGRLLTSDDFKEFSRQIPHLKVFTLESSIYKPGVVRITIEIKPGGIFLFGKIKETVCKKIDFHKAVFMEYIVTFKILGFNCEQKI